MFFNPGYYKIIESFIRTTKINYQEDKKIMGWNCYKFLNPDNEKDCLSVIYEGYFKSEDEREIYTVDMGIKGKN